MMHGTQSRSKLVRLIAGIFLAAITFGVVTPAYAASGAWIDDARGKPTLYRTSQWYYSPTIKGNSSAGVGKIRDIRYRINLDKSIPGGKNLVVFLCGAGTCEKLSDSTSSSRIQGNTSDFNGRDSNSDFFFAYQVQDWGNNPLFPQVTVLKQEVTVFFD